MVNVMPRLTVKAAAEMLLVLAYSQARILTEQKHPKQGAQIFRTPYYSTALNGIRKYFKECQDITAIKSARNKALSLNLESKRENNLRVLTAFEQSDFAKRVFVVEKNEKISNSIGTVEFRLSPDLVIEEKKKTRLIYINCRAQMLDSEIARLTAEIAHWVTEEVGIELKLNQIEYIDLYTNKTHNFKKRRQKTIKNLTENAKLIEAIWPSL